MITQATLADALAYIAITDGQKYLHTKTSVAVYRYVKMNVARSSGRFYEVSEEGMQLARQTKMWKAHERLLAMGFEFSPRGKVSPRFLRYSHPEQAQTKSGQKFFRTGFTGYHGTVYADMLNEAGDWRVTEVK